MDNLEYQDLLNLRACGGQVNSRTLQVAEFFSVSDP